MVTLGDVAKAAGTSTTTVSRVLNGCGDQYRISAKTQAEVLAAAEQLGYRPSYHARALKAGRSQTVGLMCNANILAGHAQGYWGGMMDGINRAVRLAGYNLLLTSDEDRYTTLQQGVAFWKEQRVDALITFGSVIGRYMRTNTPLAIDVPDLPLVLIESKWPLDYPQVSMHCVQALADAVNHLADLGHRRITYLQIGEQGTDRAELVGVTAATRELDCTTISLEPQAEDQRELEPWRAREARAEQIIAAWDQLADRSAVICYNDRLALALYLAARERGLRVPEDLSIIGFDDISAEEAVPAMTTINHNLVEMGRKAGEIALEMAAAPEAVAKWRKRKVRVDATFVPRRSTAAPRAG